MYVISRKGICGDKNYLCWQEPAWDEDGYFWTQKATMLDVLKSGSDCS